MLKVCKFNTPALNGRKKFHLQKTKLNDEIKQLFDNFDKKIFQGQCGNTF
jgi:hypothetical protein